MIKLPKQKRVFLMADEDINEDSTIKSKDVGYQLTNNQVYFYDDVTRLSIYSLNRNLDSVSKNLQWMKINYNLPSTPQLELLINSEGGEIFSAFSAVDRIKSSPVPIHTYIEGIAASAATLLSVCGHRRFIRKNSFMLVHQIRSGLWGSFAEFKDEMQNLDLLTRYIKTIYLAHTKISEPDLDDILKHDSYLDADKCLELGLVDEIV